MNQNNFINNTNKLLNNPPKNKLLTETYFEIQEQAESIYGKNTVVFIEIGTFYEIYESNGIGKANEIAKELNIVLTKKSKKIDEVSVNNPKLCGIPSISIEKHLEKLIEQQKWTIVIINQKVTKQNNKEIITRYVDNVISQGVNINFNTSFNYNFVTSLMVEKINNIYYCAIALIDVSVGKTLVYEDFGNTDDPNLVIDEINNFLNIYKSTEIIISKSPQVTDEDLDFITNELELYKIHYIISNQKNFDLLIDYQNEVLKEAYNVKSMLSPIEELNLETLPLATKALVVLINFIVEHSPEIIKDLQKPEILENKHKLYCGNNAIKQLNILDEKQNSIEKIINTARTAFGKRYVKDTLLNPIKDKDELLNRYKRSQEFISLSIEFKEDIKHTLYNIYDLERIIRTIELGKIQPKIYYTFILSLQKITLIQNNLFDNAFWVFNEKEDKQLNTRLTQILDEINHNFDIDKISSFSASKEDETFINLENYQGTYIEELVNKKEGLKKVFSRHQRNFLNCFETTNLDFLPKIKFTEKEGHYLELSKSKYKELKKSKIVQEKAFEKYNIKTLTNSLKIMHNDIKVSSDEIFVLQNKIIEETLNIFNSFIAQFNTMKTDIEKIILYIKKIDFYIVNNSLFSNKRCIVPEIIDTEENEKFIDAKELRHLIVEDDETNGIYIPNDFLIGHTKYFENDDKKEELNIDTEKVNGIMLHGLNASGKSTLIKSVGVAIILAQSGFFVPATSFRFSLFDTLFTRISGADNIYKGLSTFTIEMLEMKNIFNRSKGNTLILGDELSHGTETQSAISIVASGFLTLTDMDTLFFFATHLHQLNELEEIKNNKSLLPVHMHVEYDKKNEKFIFDRTLKYGQGLSTYGLEYAKYLHLDKAFIKKAYEIRKKVANDKTNLELLVEQKTSNYNSKVYMKQCAICNNPAIETHHIKEQKEADELGNIGHFHKNHKHNLIPLCSEHHNKIHHGEIILMGFSMTSEGVELQYKDLTEE